MPTGRGPSEGRRLISFRSVLGGRPLETPWIWPWRCLRRVGLELGEVAQHIEERLPGGGGGLHRLFRCSEMRAFCFRSVHDDLKGAQRPLQLANPGNDSRFLLADEAEAGDQLDVRITPWIAACS